MWTLIRYPEKADWKNWLKRPDSDAARIRQRVEEILSSVRAKGDKALLELTAELDGVHLDRLALAVPDPKTIARRLPAGLLQAIDLAMANIRKFHEAQLTDTVEVETMPGIRCWQKSLPIESVGLYIPGGSAPLFSTLMMLAVPARIAGCRQLVVCSPPMPDGQLHPALLYVAGVCEIPVIYRVGGAQAIAAMAWGTETIPRVDKIFGPGNRYVTMAKQLLQQEGIAIDMPAGPSEVAVLGDSSCPPEFAAADLLSQAEHGPDSQVILVSTDESWIQAVEAALHTQLSALPRQEIAAHALSHSKAFLMKDEEQAIELLNAYAPEHLILACRNAHTLANKILHAGSVFIGQYAPESVGDYASGTNHTLPTAGYARAWSGVHLDSFRKKISFQELTLEGLRAIGPAVETLALAEGLQAHQQAVAIRLQYTKNSC
ncbi:histidinol dehydrogenase [Thermoflavifilum thermophilum]|uniref:Histidinol dehydrogenase n=1 Tax=Thermoflavifilum thermophilum TaxID=1393122 RepID=A0A1I7NHH2_9BACT|nr:histidinol dehydrogenase [Thermoflavifilum thermophilum]SFV33986.1 histidinol dehydrogenase [Thermoflavifilum thermophilum]